MPYGDVVELALYHPEHGFYASGGHAGRRGDFITSPEVGPLFGHVIANAIDAEWRRLGEPQRFVVIDWGAGPGTLLRSVLAAQPACLDALELVAVERSAAQRASHPLGVTSIGELTGDEFRGQVGCVIANELLDNLAFSPVVDVDGALVNELVDITEGSPASLTTRPGLRVGSGEAAWFTPEATRGVDQSGAAEWLERALRLLSAGRVIVIDYARRRSDEVKIRTYADHGEAGDPLVGLGTKDITVDVDLFQLQARVRSADDVCDQATWLRRHGLDELVEEGQRIWEAKAATGSLEALKGRSRLREAEALTESTGLGGFLVSEWVI